MRWIATGTTTTRQMEAPRNVSVLRAGESNLSHFLMVLFCDIFQRSCIVTFFDGLVMWHFLMILFWHIFGWSCFVTFFDGLVLWHFLMVLFCDILWWFCFVNIYGGFVSGQFVMVLCLFFTYHWNEIPNKKRRQVDLILFHLIFSVSVSGY